MTIYRTHDDVRVVIELSKDELYNAYLEQQNEFDKEDFRASLEQLGYGTILERYGVSEAYLEQHLSELASEMRERIRKYDISFVDATDEVLKHVSKTQRRKREKK